MPSGKFRTFSIAFLSLVLVGCSTYWGGQFFAQRAPDTSATDGRLSPEGDKLLLGFVDSARLPEMQWPDFSDDQADVRAFYVSQGHTLAWVRNAKPTEQARAILHALQNADLKGLRPADYDGPLWDERLNRLNPPPAAESDLVKFDLALTVAAIRYVSDLHMGRVNPRVFHFGLDLGIDHQQFSRSDFLEQKLVHAEDVDEVLRTIDPPFPIYRRTEQALKKYLDLSRQGDVDALPTPSRPVKPGDSYEGIPKLARLLALLGDLRADQTSELLEGTYRDPLVAGVKNFQRRHGLAPNGIIDAPTLKELNTPLSERVMQLQLAMERIRWLPHQFARPPIVVNIPEFRLYAVNDEYRSVFTMKVVVGKAFGHQTPVFADEIKSVLFRPYWNVPETIAIPEIIPHLKKDPDYLAANDYEIVDRNAKVIEAAAQPNEIAAQLRSGAWRIRQIPGRKNALGLIKFEFPNTYDVYMHGTPASELFSRSRRDFSHGCIRVEDPVALAEWVLRDMPGWDEEKIRAAMNGDETIAVRLTRPIPVLIFYSTAVVLEGDEPHFYDDIYGLDTGLEKLLREGYPYSGEGDLQGKK